MNTRPTRFALGILIVVACACRLTVRLATGGEAFLDNSYSFYLSIAATALEGDGWCVAPNVGCALRLPVYPMLLVPFVASDTVYPGVAVLQSVAGAAIVGVVFAIGRELFGDRAGGLAALLASVSPYAVVHDTALQETVFVNLLTVVTLYWLVRRRGSMTVNLTLAGVAVSAAVLTSARVALFVPAVALWLVARDSPGWRVRAVHVMAFLLPVCVLVGGWMVRNWTVVGAPVLTTESGASLYVANNEWTFTHFPERSIDLSVRESVARLPPERARALEALSGDPVAEDRLLAAWARDYVRNHPGETLRGAMRKLWVVAAAEFSPHRGHLAQIGYRALYGTLHLVALFGLWRASSAGPHGAAVAILLAFLLTTAIFWAHTSHKSVIDGVLMVYAAGAVLGARRQRAAEVGFGA